MSEYAVEHPIRQPSAMTASIFISYASKDRAAAHTICDALEHRGFDCWIADRDIGPGENFQVSIVHAIRSAKAMILVFSANAANSEEIKKEIVLAGQSRLVVIPVRVEDVAPDEAFAYEMATRQWIDLFGDWEQSVQRLARQLETVTHIKPDLKVTTGTPVAEQGPGSDKEPLAPSFPGPAAESESSPPTKPAAPLPKKLDWRLIGAPGAAAAVIAAVLALWLSFGHSNSLALVRTPVTAYAEPGEPNTLCTQADFRQWDNCVGTHSYPNGNAYRGEFHHGLREGFGVIAINARGVSNENDILSNEQSEYIGEFHGGRLNGHGVWFTASGAGYSGTFVNNIPQSVVSQRNCNGRPSSAWTNCVAEQRYPNGNIYRGEFVQGLRQGVGLLQINATGASDADNIRTPVPGIYVGEFMGGRLNGHGVIMMPDAGFYGLFTDNIFTPFPPHPNRAVSLKSE
jgi:hypothetical protein